MSTATAKQIKQALQKALCVGQVEEPFDLVDFDCHVVLRSLRPDEYERALEECAELEDVAYLNAYRMSHLMRSVVEINGVDLRTIDYVEVEEEDPKTHKVKTVKVERPAFLRDHVLSTWGKEALDTTFRKFLDVVAKAEEASQKGVTFTTPDESPEDKFRRLVTEMRVAEAEVIPSLATSVLKDAGYIHISTQEELQATEERLSKLGSVELEQGASNSLAAEDLQRRLDAIQPVGVEDEPAPAPVAVQPPVQPPRRPAPQPAPSPQRVPLNRTVALPPPEPAVREPRAAGSGRAAEVAAEMEAQAELDRAMQMQSEREALASERPVAFVPDDVVPELNKK